MIEAKLDDLEHSLPPSERIGADLDRVGFDLVEIASQRDLQHRIASELGHYREAVGYGHLTYARVQRSRGGAERDARGRDAI